MEKPGSNPFFHSMRLLRVHRVLLGLVSLVVFIGASVSAVQTGTAPFLGVLVVFFVMAVFFIMFYILNKQIERGLVKGEIKAWVGALFWALTMSVVLIGIPAVRELLSPEIRQRFR